MYLPSHELRQDAWFAGSTDGEGCFLISRIRGGDEAVPRFCITLRADERPLADQLLAAFGGSYAISEKRTSPGAKPRLSYVVASKGDLLGLVDYFDRFGLRAKKARDYAIWRQSVPVYVSQGSRAGAPIMLQLREALLATRLYESGGDPFADLQIQTDQAELFEVEA